MHGSRITRREKILYRSFTRGHFFFQAEDGIRDGTVTGVQTCALPISTAVTMAGLARPALPSLSSRRGPHDRDPSLRWERSEERRVGKSVDLGGRRITKKKKELK